MGEILGVGAQFESYVIDSVIGRGKTSVVYGVEHPHLGIPVALKVLAPAFCLEEEFRERFLRDAQMAATLSHPNVNPIHDAGFHEGSLFIVTRYVDGGDLRHLLKSGGALAPERALELLTPVASALDAAHAHGLTHRSVKPTNILLGRAAAVDGAHVYVTDFGGTMSAAAIEGLRTAGGLIGTIGYVAPEQFEGREATARTDVYALAVTLYECLTGRIPFQRELAEGVRPPKGAAEPVSSVRAELPATLDDVVAKALSRNPRDRYVTCEQFLRACAYVLGAREEMLARGPGSAAAGEMRRAWRPVKVDPAPAGGGRRRRPLVLAGALAVAVLAVGAAVLASGGSGASPTRAGAGAGDPVRSALAPVPDNDVSGSGDVTLALSGNTATITVTTHGLDGDASLVHVLHIHGGGKGECPPASAAEEHNGHLTINAMDGINYYGPPVLSLTTREDTSPASYLAFKRFPVGGELRYRRTLTLPQNVVNDIRDNNAVVVVHGVDYDGSGIYDDSLGVSEDVPETATLPALCGRLDGPTTPGATATASPAHGGTLRYTASLAVNPAVTLLGEAFGCSPGAPLSVIARPLRAPEEAAGSAAGGSLSA